MKKGDKVKIYQKPLTEEDFEGEAILISKNLTGDIENTETWWVKFNKDHIKCLRTIKVK